MGSLIFVKKNWPQKLKWNSERTFSSYQTQYVESYVVPSSLRHSKDRSCFNEKGGSTIDWLSSKWVHQASRNFCLWKNLRLGRLQKNNVNLSITSGMENQKQPQTFFYYISDEDESLYHQLYREEKEWWRQITGCKIWSS